MFYSFPSNSFHPLPGAPVKTIRLRERPFKMFLRVCCLIGFFTFVAFIAYGKEESTADQKPASLPPATRTEALIRARHARRSNLKPYHLSWLNDVNLSFEKVSRLSSIGLFPHISVIRSGSGPGPEIEFLRNDFVFSVLDLRARTSITLLGYQEHEFALGEWSPKAGPIAFLKIRYDRYTRERFFGLGNQSRKADESDFFLEDFRVSINFGYAWQDFLRVFGTVEHLAIHISNGRDPDLPDTLVKFADASVPGLAKQPDFIRTALSLALDLRDYPEEPHRGAYLSVSWERFDDRNTNALFNFNRLIVDARAYLPLFSPARTFAIRGFTSLSYPQANKTVPFYFMDTLGGKDVLRGFETFRFRDRHLLFVILEYRWELFKYANVVLFYETGKVFHENRDFNLTQLHHDFGWGLRFKNHHRVFLILEMAFSNEETRFIFRTGSEF